MYREKEEQKEMITLCENLLNYIFDIYDKKELDKVSFISKCSFACGFYMPPMVKEENMIYWNR